MTTLPNDQGLPKRGRHGGLKQLEQLFRLSDRDTEDPPPDVILVSIDLEVSRDERALVLQNENYKPHIREVGIAWMDLRHVFSARSPQSQSLILTRQFSTSSASKDFEDCDFTDFRECVFAETFRVATSEIPASITRSLRFQDDSPVKSKARLRDIAIVGHSLTPDLNIIKRLGVDLGRVAPIVAVLDTHLLSRYILGNDNPQPALLKFSLGAILEQLQCPHNSYELHNVGNDATYTLHVLLSLALRWAESKELKDNESLNVGYLKSFRRTQLYETPRWEPVRGSLGAHCSKSESAEMA